MVTIKNDSLPTPSFATQPERKEIPTSSTRQETMIHANTAAYTLVSQVTPLLGITPHESTQLQNTKNVENFQTSLNLQQTYSVALGSHINNIYHKISEIQQQLPHPTQHMNTGDIIQINALEFDPDIDGGPPTKEHGEIQGSDSSMQHLLRESKKNEAPALPQQVAEEVDWLDTVPVEIPPQPTQDNDHNIIASPT